MKKLIKSIVFILIFIFIFNKVFNVLWLPKNSTSYFYSEPKKSLDVVYFGASNAYIHFNTTLAYKQYGFTTGFLSSGNQPPMMIKYLIKDAQKYQNPKLYIIDINQFAKDFDFYEEGDIRNSVDAMKFSKNRIDAINEVFKYINIEKSDPNSTSGNNKINYYFSFFKYHNSWKNISSINFMGDNNLYKSFYAEPYTFTIEQHAEYNWPNTREPLAEGMEKILMDLFSYINKNNLNVLFVVPNKAWSDLKIYDATPTKLNTVIDILQENNFDVINFNTLNDFKIDLNDGVYNRGHINFYSSIKYTLYFSKYLCENYNLPDHRNDKKYQSWDQEYIRLKELFLRLDGRDYEEVVNSYKDEIF